MSRPSAPPPTPTAKQIICNTARATLSAAARNPPSRKTNGTIFRRSTARRRTTSSWGSSRAKNASRSRNNAPKKKRPRRIQRKGRKVAKKSRKPRSRIGSAAADWSRWPVGTTFRVLSTGQVYKVDDYGWALAGRNTIDLYMGSRGDMNRWGVRHEKIKVLSWGDRSASIGLLTARQHYKHCRRMLLQLQGLDEQAAALN